MRVDPKWHGQGFGTALYQELEQRASSDGHRHLVPDTGVENDTARGFYEGVGFECQTTVTVEFDELAIDIALYGKEIGH